MELEEILLEDGGGGDRRSEVVFKITGITCDKCVRLITECLTEMEGILQAQVCRGECPVIPQHTTVDGGGFLYTGMDYSGSGPKTPGLGGTCLIYHSVREILADCCCYLYK